MVIQGGSFKGKSADLKPKEVRIYECDIPTVDTLFKFIIHRVFVFKVYQLNSFDLICLQT